MDREYLNGILSSRIKYQNAGGSSRVICKRNEQILSRKRDLLISSALGIIRRTFISILLSIFLFSNSSAKNKPIILLDPAGHAKDPGRLIVEGYERSETLKFAMSLQKQIESKYKIRAVISRTPGEEILPLQIPSFSNRIKAKFFLRINMYRMDSEKPKIFLYHLTFDPFADFSRKDYGELQLTHLYQAHTKNIHTTKKFGSQVHEYLNQNQFKKYFDSHPLSGMPIKHLSGIIAPAILLEIGICRENKWESLVEHIADSLNFLNNLDSFEIKQA